MSSKWEFFKGNNLSVLRMETKQINTFEI